MDPINLKIYALGICYSETRAKLTKSRTLYLLVRFSDLQTCSMLIPNLILVQYIVSRSSAEDLMVLYSLPAFPDNDANGFLKAFARTKGFVQMVRLC
jgi:hypothetical protein